MAYTVNWITKVITVPTSDLTLVSGTRYQLNLENFLNEVRRLEWEFTEGLWADHILVHDNVRTDFAGANYAAFDEVVNGYTVTITGVATRVDLLGSNNNIADVINNTNLILTSANSAGLTNIAEVRAMAYASENKGVTIAQSTGTDSAIYPTGTRERPCATEQNIHDISKGAYRKVFVPENLVLTIDHAIVGGYTFIADNPLSINVHCGDVATYPNKDVTNCKFQDCYVTGELDNANILWECVAGAITNANNFIYKSAMLGQLDISQNLMVWKCAIAPDAPSQEFTIDFKSLAKTVIVAEWGAGRIRVKNMVAGSFIGMAGAAGRLIIDTANTGGTAVYSGGIGIDDTFAANIDTLTDSTTAGAVWTKLAAEDLRKAEFNRRVHDKTLNTITLFDDDKITPYKVFDADDDLTDISPQ